MSKTRGRRNHIRVSERRIIDPQRAWYVAATWGVDTSFDESAADRKAEEALRDAGLDVWMPIYEETIARRGKKIDAVLHFFPGYLFVGLSTASEDDHDHDMQALRRCRYTAAILGVDKPLRINVELMQVIADAFTGNVKSERLQAAALYRVGEMARVATGPFASFYAVVVELLQSGHVKADVQIFGRATPVQFEPGQLEPT